MQLGYKFHINVLNTMTIHCFLNCRNDFCLFLCLQSLTLLEYLLKTGSDRIPKQSQENIHLIKPLVEYRYTDKDGKDQVPGLPGVVYVSNEQYSFALILYSCELVRFRSLTL